MKKVLIACLMMELETKNALEVTGSDAEVIWMEKGLHNKPENLWVVLCSRRDIAGLRLLRQRHAGTARGHLPAGPAPDR